MGGRGVWDVALLANSQSWMGNVKSVAVELKENTSAGCQLEPLLPARTRSLYQQPTALLHSSPWPHKPPTFFKGYCLPPLLALKSIKVCCVESSASSDIWWTAGLKRLQVSGGRKQQRQEWEVSVPSHDAMFSLLPRYLVRLTYMQ